MRLLASVITACCGLYAASAATKGVLVQKMDFELPVPNTGNVLSLASTGTLALNVGPAMDPPTPLLKQHAAWTLAGNADFGSLGGKITPIKVSMDKFDVTTAVCDSRIKIDFEGSIEFPGFTDGKECGKSLCAANCGMLTFKGPSSVFPYLNCYTSNQPNPVPVDGKATFKFSIEKDLADLTLKFSELLASMSTLDDSAKILKTILEKTGSDVIVTVPAASVKRYWTGIEFTPNVQIQAMKFSTISTVLSEAMKKTLGFGDYLADITIDVPATIADKIKAAPAAMFSEDKERLLVGTTALGACPTEGAKFGIKLKDMTQEIFDANKDAVVKGLVDAINAQAGDKLPEGFGMTTYQITDAAFKDDFITGTAQAGVGRAAGALTTWMKEIVDDKKSITVDTASGRRLSMRALAAKEYPAEEMSEDTDYKCDGDAKKAGACADAAAPKGSAGQAVEEAGMGGGAVAGIVIGVLAAVGVMAVLGTFYKKNKRMPTLADVRGRK